MEPFWSVSKTVYTFFMKLSRNISIRVRRFIWRDSRITEKPSVVSEPEVTPRNGADAVARAFLYLPKVEAVIS